MSSIDPTVASRLDSASDDFDEDDLLESLENDDSIDQFRERRVQQLHDELTRQKAMKDASPGVLEEIKEEKALMDIVTNSKLCIVHFFKSDFGKCGVMDEKLKTLAPKHFDTRFLKINVDSAPFLVTKMKVQMLPCVIAFVNGAGVDRIIGFEGLGLTGNDFSAGDLERRLLQIGVLTRIKIGEHGVFSSREKKSEAHDESDDEWD